MLATAIGCSPVLVHADRQHRCLNQGEWCWHLRLALQQRWYNWLAWMGWGRWKTTTVLMHWLLHLAPRSLWIVSYRATSHHFSWVERAVPLVSGWKPFLAERG